MNGPMFGEPPHREEGEYYGAVKHHEEPIDHNLARHVCENDNDILKGPVSTSTRRAFGANVFAFQRRLPRTQGVWRLGVGSRKFQV